MEVKKVEIERGWGWIQDGWKMFMKNPRVWVLVTLIGVLLLFLLYFVPILGPLADGLLGTLLGGGIIYGAFKLDQGGALEIAQLFQVFRDPAKTGPMLILGCVSAVGNLLMAVLSKGLIATPFTGAGMMGQGYVVQFGATVLLGLLLVLLVAALLAVVLCYAIPLVMLDDMEPFEAMKESAIGCLRNWQPWLLFGLTVAILSVLTVFTLGLGFLILGPVMVGAWYQSYKDIYGG